MRKSESEEAALLAAIGMGRAPLEPPKRAGKVAQYTALVLFVFFLVGLGVLIAMAFQVGPTVLEAVCQA